MTKEIDDKYYNLVAANINKDPDQNTYFVEYRMRDLKGNIVKKSKKRGFKTMRDAKAYLETLKREHAEAMFKADNPMLTMTFAELYERYKVSRLCDKPSTIIGRESIVTARIMPFFSEMEIKDITQDTVSQWHSFFYDEEGKQLFSDTYLRSLHSRLSAILNYAVYCGWITQNPAKKCSIGAKNASERPVWTPQEYKRFRRAIADEPVDYYAFEVLYFTGLRKGELLALNIDDVDFKTHQLKVTKSLAILKGKEYITSPKTKKSVRNVRLNSELEDELKEYLASRPGCKGTDRLFPVKKEQLRYALARGTEKAGLSPITIHCFRHSHITNLIAAGYSPVDIANRVGHESIYITLHYSHAFKNVENDIAESLNRLMEAMG